MDASTIYSNHLAARESVIVVWRLFGAAGFETPEKPRYDIEWEGFQAKKKEIEVAVDWFTTSGLRVRFVSGVNEEIREAVSGLLTHSSIPEDQVI